MKNSVVADLTLSVMTLRGIAFPERIRAASAAGFRGIGWRLEDFNTNTEHEIVRLLDESEVLPIEVEFFRDWVGLEGQPAYQKHESALLKLAGRLKARHINVAVFERESQEEIVAALSGLCGRAAEYDLLVQLEFMPYDPSVSSLHAAWEVVRKVAAPNAGLLLDAWHWARSPGSEEALVEIPANQITGVQLSGHLPEPLRDMAEESRHYRQLPGDEAVRFLRLLELHGVSCPLSVEVMSDDLDKLPPAEATTQVADAARSVLRKAKWQSLRN
jgi:sugar phosphate isomerase/epimerase